MRFFTNLDECKHYMFDLTQSWKSKNIPRTGEYIKINGRKKFRLMVVAVSYDDSGSPEVELHLGGEFSSISAFEEWWKR